MPTDAATDQISKCFAELVKQTKMLPILHIPLCTLGMNQEHLPSEGWFSWPLTLR